MNFVQGKKREPNFESSASACNQKAREMMLAAVSADSEQAKVDFLRLATEWLRLATEISNRTADGDDRQ